MLALGSGPIIIPTFKMNLLFLLINHFLFSLQVTRVDGHGSISGPNEVRKVFFFVIRAVF